MKKIILFLIILTIGSCSITKNFYNLNCISIDNEGYVQLKINSQSKLSKNKIESASKDAIYTILYSGYTSKECQTQKPILKEFSEIDNFKNIESNFFSAKGKWKVFVRNSLDTNNIKTDKTKNKEFVIMVNKDQLRKYLEEQKIIKSLNIGF